MKTSNLKSQISNLCSRIKRLWGRRRFRRLLIVSLILNSLFLILGFVFIVRPGLKVYAAVKEARPHIRALKDSLILQDLQMTRGELGALDEKLSKVEEALGAVSWADSVPLVKNYYRDAQHLLAAAGYGLETGRILIETIEPFADVFGFKTETTAAVLDAEKKVQGLVKAMPQVVLRMDEISGKFRLIHQELDQVDPNRYPQSFRGQSIRPLLADAKQSMNRVEQSMPDIKELLTILPSVLGDPQPKTYLVLFQNDKELRPTGGFLTAYALVTVKNGEITNVSSDDIYHLDESMLGHLAPPPAVLAQYLQVKSYWARDTNLSPDFKESMLEFEKFWDRAPGVPKIDGIIGMDTYVVQKLLEVLGPVKLPDYEEEFNSENIVYQLELYANLLGKFKWDRKDLLGRLMNAILEKAFHAPREQWKPLFAEALKLVEEKHILLYLHAPMAQGLAEKYNYAGRLRDFDGDYLHINDANFAGRKANWYVEEKVTKEIVRNGEKIESVVTIDYENTGEYHSEWNTGYRDYVRVYVPRGSKLISSFGSLHPVVTFEDLGKTVFAGYIACDPLQKASFTVKYELPFNVPQGQMLIQKQPGTEGHLYKIIVNGKAVEEFELVVDREVSVGNSITQ